MMETDVGAEQVLPCTYTVKIIRVFKGNMSTVSLLLDP